MWYWFAHHLYVKWRIEFRPQTTTTTKRLCLKWSALEVEGPWKNLNSGHRGKDTHKARQALWLVCCHSSQPVLKIWFSSFYFKVLSSLDTLFSLKFLIIEEKNEIWGFTITLLQFSNLLCLCKHCQSLFKIIGKQIMNKTKMDP